MRVTASYIDIRPIRHSANVKKRGFGAEVENVVKLSRP